MTSRSISLYVDSPRIHSAGMIMCFVPVHSNDRSSNEIIRKTTRHRTKMKRIRHQRIFGTAYGWLANIGNMRSVSSPLRKMVWTAPTSPPYVNVLSFFSNGIISSLQKQTTMITSSYAVPLSSYHEKRDRTIHRRPKLLLISSPVWINLPDAASSVRTIQLRI